MRNTMQIDFAPYLQPTYFLDHQSAEVQRFTGKICAAHMDDREKAIKLYNAVRDSILYDPYDIEKSRSSFKASSVLKKKSGYCVPKAILLAALGRQQGIPTRLGYADVTNHISTKRLTEWIGTNLFIYHGYTEFYLNDRWVKATPAFNLSLCRRFNILPLEFDGTHDSIFHEYDTQGHKHMEYVKEHGHFADLPFEILFQAYEKVYPNIFSRKEQLKENNFAREAARENTL